MLPTTRSSTTRLIGSAPVGWWVWVRDGYGDVFEDEPVKATSRALARSGASVPAGDAGVRVGGWRAAAEGLPGEGAPVRATAVSSVRGAAGWSAAAVQARTVARTQAVQARAAAAAGRKRSPGSGDDPGVRGRQHRSAGLGRDQGHGEQHSGNQQPHPGDSRHLSFFEGRLIRRRSRQWVCVGWCTTSRVNSTVSIQALYEAWRELSSSVLFWPQDAIERCSYCHR